MRESIMVARRSSFLGPMVVDGGREQERTDDILTVDQLILQLS